MTGNIEQYNKDTTPSISKKKILWKMEKIYKADREEILFHIVTIMPRV